MVSLSWVMILFVLYAAVFIVYYFYYFRPRMYLLLLSETNYMNCYLSKLPHMDDGSSDRSEMEAFLLKKRSVFLRRCNRFLFSAAAFYVVLVLIAADF
ncbi:hypothetical protein [Desulfovibrio inopinatus]|uniref:hypothetical protein n=1 Tax=Desulfovibrio inopinatus TaxID=102109 RepID=UPI00041269AC|nr:hypothetical protein [Desulfovibrio inopinatus]